MQSRKSPSRPDDSAAFVGRETTLSTLDDFLCATRDDSSRFLLITGEPGIGKTQILEEARRRAEASGMLVAAGRCAEVEGAPEYWPLRQILSTLESSLESTLDEESGLDLQTFVGDGSPVLDLLTRRGPARFEDETARFRMLADLGAWFAALCERGPLVILLDDLHRLDRSSAQLLAFLSSELENAPLRIVAAARESEIESHPTLSADLGRFFERARPLSLGPMSREAIMSIAERLSGRALERETAEQLFARSAGNPLFLRQLIEWLRLDSPDFAPGDLARQIAEGTPHGLRQVIEERLRALSSGERRVLEVAAVLGREFARDLLLILAKRESLDRAAAQIEALRDRAVLVDCPDEPGSLRFEHVLLRDVAYHAIEPTHRQTLHAAACEAILEHRDVDEDVWLDAAAHHAIEGAHPEVLDLARRAGDRALTRCADEGAASWFRAALAMLAPLGGSKLLRAQLEERLATALWRIGAASEAREGFLRAMDLAAQADDAATFAAAAIGYAGRTDRALSPEPDAQTHLEEALDRLESTAYRPRAEVLHRLASCLYFLEDEAERERVAAEAVHCAERTGDARLLSYALSSQHFIRWRPGQGARRRPVGERQLAAAAKVPRSDALAFAHFNCAKDAFEIGDALAVDGHIRALGEEASRLRRPFFAFQHAGLLATRFLSMGEVERAEEQLGALLHHGQQAGSSNVQPAMASLMHGVRQAQGRLAELEGPVSEAVRAFPQMTAGRFALAEIRCEIGERSQARAFLAGIFAQGLDALPRDFNLAACLVAATNIVIELGEEAWARELIEALEPWSGECAVLGFGNGWAGAWDLHRGRLLATIGDYDAAERTLDASAELHARFEATSYLAHSWLAKAEVLSARGRAGDAETAQNIAWDARAVYEKLGMQHLVRKASSRRFRSEASGDPVRRSETGSTQIGPGAAPPENAAFRRAGDVWQIEFGGRAVTLRDAKGLRDLAILLARPHEDVPAIELYGPIESTGPSAPGDGDALLDLRAQREIAARIEELRDEMETARQHADLALAERSRGELEALEAELASASGLAGRSRRYGGPLERARKAVTNRIRTAIRRITQAHPGLGAHLERAVQTGRSCVYRPASPVDWSL